MKNLIVMKIIIAMFGIDILNTYTEERDSIAIILGDGTVAKITCEKIV